MSAAIMGRSLGLLVCMRCRATVRADAPRAAREPPLCPRCRSRLHVRKPHSAVLTATYLAMAAVLYIPANLLPVFSTRTLFSRENDTIMSGVLVLLDSGSWPLAVIVFIASIVVPLLKIVALAFLLISVRRKSASHPLQRSRLFRLVEYVGRWSMLDVYVVGLLVAVVQVQSVASIHAGAGALAFSAVVVLTLLAAHSFDERLIWDDQTHG
jgi:paraquat-inducible protein A